MLVLILFLLMVSIGVCTLGPPRLAASFLREAPVAVSEAQVAWARRLRRRSAVADAAPRQGAIPVGRPRPSVSVVIPALNEEHSIDWVVDQMPPWVSEVILVDGLSLDRTERIVTDRREGVVIVHQRSPGKGAALRAGFTAATGEVIVMIDADGSTDPREMDRYVAALSGGADFVKGSRNLPGGGSVDFTRLRHLGNLGFVHAANLLFGVRFTDLCYGYCAFWRRDLERLALTADGFEIEMQLIVSAIKAGLRIEEVPSMELARRAGDSNLNAWRDGRRVLATLLTERVRRLDPTRADRARIALTAVELAAHDTPQWRPAGADRRRYGAPDRRTGAPEGDAPPAGPDRRSGADRRRGGDRRADRGGASTYDGPERRRAPERTVRVLFAQPAANLAEPGAPPVQDGDRVSGTA
ncbi:MAG TPA: glycosyltransferase family 2 protein [Solirubrobacteraceae bacterium]|nr:glycosyltransferase family 2 protein [Solirubrobacteraceae bacterium]